MAALLGFGCSFFPEFVKPVLILPLVVTALGNMELAFISSTYLWLVMGMIMSCTGMEMTSGVMLILFGIVLAKTLEDEKMDVWHVILVVCLSISFPVLFYYINYETSQMTLMIWGAVEGLAISGFLGMFDEKMQTARDEEVENKLDDILDNSIAQLQEQPQIPTQTPINTLSSNIQEQNNQMLGQQQTPQITPLNQVNQELQETRKNDIADSVQAMNLEKQPEFKQKQGNYV